MQDGGGDPVLDDFLDVDEPAPEESPEQPSSDPAPLEWGDAGTAEPPAADESAAEPPCVSEEFAETDRSLDEPWLPAPSDDDAAADALEGAAVERVAWEVVPQLAERLIRETIERLQQEPPKP